MLEFISLIFNTSTLKMRHVAQCESAQVQRILERQRCSTKSRLKRIQDRKTFDTSDAICG
jgi:hypothetical protein